MAKKAFVWIDFMGTGDSDAVPPFNPVYTQVGIVCIDSDNTFVPGVNSAQVEVSYLSTFLTIKLALAAKVREAYGDPLMAVVWMDDKGLA